MIRPLILPRSVVIAFPRRRSSRNIVPKRTVRCQPPFMAEHRMQCFDRLLPRPKSNRHRAAAANPKSLRREAQVSALLGVLLILRMAVVFCFAGIMTNNAVQIVVPRRAVIGKLDCLTRLLGNRTPQRELAIVATFALPIRRRTLQPRSSASTTRPLNEPEINALSD